MLTAMNEKPTPTASSRTDECEEVALTASAAGDPRAVSAAVPPADPLPAAWTRVSHESLFVDPGPRCDVCDVPLSEDEGDNRDHTKHGVGGHGLYVWIRGGETVYEEPPLCVACGTAIGMSTIARWDIEEEEG
jgi:hypothetical protein